MNNDSILHLYMMNKISISALYEQGRVALAKELSHVLLDEIENAKIDDIIKDVVQNSKPIILSGNIPQFSSFENGTIYLIKHLRMLGDFGPSLEEIGAQFLDGGKKKGAYVKYGENHSKLARQYDLVYFVKQGSNKVFLTELGKLIEKLEIGRQNKILEKLSLRIPIVQYCLKNNIKCPNNIERIMNNFLSEKTALRRKSNVCKIINLIIGGSK